MTGVSNLEILMGMDDSVRTVAPGCCNSAGLAGYELQKLLHRVWICNQEIFFIPLSFAYIISS
jgi:hypothetical protein